VSEILQDWDIRTEPGVGGDIRLENVGGTLSLFPSGRAKPSSSAELREEVAEASAYGCMSAVGSKSNEDQKLA